MKSWLISSIVVLAAWMPLHADDVDYAKTIKPLLAEKCSACHGALKQESGLRLDAGKLILQGSDAQPVLVPGDSKNSLLIERVSGVDPDTRMPPHGDGEPLSEQQVSILQQWIDQGARFPSDEVVLEDPSEHWAYQLPKKTAPPAADEEDTLNPIDAFLRQQQIQIGLQPLGQADRHTLLRRMHFDLVGLPPTRRAIAEFVNDDSPDVIEQTIDHLLASQHFGERWARHWMDVWRYSDWDGYKNELRGSQRHIWHWRDWIVRSLNDDKAYDQMILEMLAGDELSPTDPGVLAATGYLARNFHKSNRNIWLDATVEHTAKAFLGMTLNCARCHDHKFDPIPQQAYYQFRAIFEPHKIRTERLPGQPNLQNDGIPRAYDAELDAPTFLYIAGDEKNPDKEQEIRPNVPSILGSELKIQRVRHPAESYRPGLREFVIAEETAKLQESVAKAENRFRETVHQPLLYFEWIAAKSKLQSYRDRLLADQKKLASSIDEEELKTLTLRAAASERESNYQLARLKWANKQAELDSILNRNWDDQQQRKTKLEKTNKELAAAEQALEKSLVALARTDNVYRPVGETHLEFSSGRRLALARWIASRQNPLTARVAVNQIWMRHFGTPLVENVFDFGLRSPRPIHEQLLDWLAVELMEHDWSLKHIHRLIMTSQTWQQASSSDSLDAERNRNIDPDNLYYWRMNARRMDAEIIRDNLLAVSGQLDATIGGPDIDFRKGETSRRRSLYLRHAYEKQMTMLVIFDAANPNECYRRSESVIPQQALALVNSALSLDQSRLLARTVESEIASDQAQPDRSFVELCFLQTLGRPATEPEIDSCLEFLRQQVELLTDTDPLTKVEGQPEGTTKPSTNPTVRARENLAHVLINHNDFLTVR